jgi:hypothetical protein
MFGPVTHDRHKLLRDLFDRAHAAGKKVYGYFSGSGHGGPLSPEGRCHRIGLTPKEQIELGAKIDRAQVEGDRDWVRLPPN